MACCIELVKEEERVLGVDLGLEVEKVYLLCDGCGIERRATVENCVVCELSAAMTVVIEENRRLRDMVGDIRKNISCEPKLGVQETVEKSVSLRDENKCGTERKDEWLKVTNGCRPKIDLARGASPVQCSNRFAPISESRREEPTKVALGSETDPEVLLVGDSQVRYLDRNFCGNKRKRMRVCLPGAKVNDIVERFDSLVKGCEKNAVIVTHVGINDIPDKRAGSLYKSYVSLLQRMKTSGRKCVVSGILPRMNVGNEWMSRALGMNDMVKRLCESKDYKDVVRFVNGWDSFYGKKELYALDGLHLSRSGVKQLEDLFERSVSAQGN